jgi:hypothetical protein
MHSATCESHSYAPQKLALLPIRWKVGLSVELFLMGQLNQKFIGIGCDIKKIEKFEERVKVQLISSLYNILPSLLHVVHLSLSLH